jgi:adenylate cyclase
MPEHVVNEILANPAALSLGGKNQVATILFSDIRGFTALSEVLAPETLIMLLNRYFSATTPIVFQHQGWLDKFMGDGMMALFGVPHQEESAAVNAVSAAVDIQRRLLTFNEELRSAGLPQIATGIGINTGKVTVGYIGSERRADYSAVGDAVNLAARLEKQAEAGQIIISEDTLEALHNRFLVAYIGEKPIRGKRESVPLYEVIWQEYGPSSSTKI